MPLEHSHVTELLVPYLQHDRERRAAQARTLRLARAAHERTPAGRGLPALIGMLRLAAAALQPQRSRDRSRRAPQRTADEDRGRAATPANRATRGRAATAGARATLRPAARGSRCATCA